MGPPIIKDNNLNITVSGVDSAAAPVYRFGKWSSQHPTELLTYQSLECQDPAVSVGLNERRQRDEDPLIPKGKLRAWA